MVREPGAPDDPKVNGSLPLSQDSARESRRRASETKLTRGQILCPGWDDGERNRPASHSGRH